MRSTHIGALGHVGSWVFKAASVAVSSVLVLLVALPVLAAGARILA
jgi:hypothetical protein